MVKLPARVVAAVTALLILSGCTRSPAPVPTPAAVDIRLADYRGMSAPYLDSLLAAFAEKHPRVRVVKVPLPYPPDDVELKRMVKAGEVDLFPTGLAAVWYVSGEPVALDLLQYVQKSRFDLGVYETARDELYKHGRLIALPVAVHPYVIVANKQLAGAAGVTLPTERWTWDQFRELAVRVAKPGSKPTYGFYAARHATSLLQTWVDQAVQPGVGQPEQAAVGDGLTFLAGLIEAGALPIEPTDGSTVQFWNLKQAAMTMLPASELVSLNPFPADWEAVPFPTHPGAKPLAPATVLTYSMSPATTHPEEAWDLLSFMAGPEAAVIIGRSGRLPYRLTAEAKQAFLDASPRLPRSISAALDSQWTILPSYTARNRSSDLWEAAFKVLTGGSPGAALTVYERFRAQ